MLKNRNKQIWIVIMAVLFLLSSGLVTIGTAQETGNSIGTIAEKARESISKGLGWLRAHQMEDGSWMGDVGITAFALSAFANNGIGEDDEAVKKAVDFVLSKRTSDGSFTMGANTVYYTSVCVVGLSSTRNPDYKDEVQSAIKYLESVRKTEQNSDEEWWVGGIGYGGDGRPDLSNNQFAIMAFHSASTVYNIDVDENIWDDVVTFTTRCQNKLDTNPDYAAFDDGGFMYYPGYSHAGEGASYGSMTAAGVWCYVLGGVSREDSRVTAAMNWLDEHRDTFAENPGLGDIALYYYYWTYARAMTLYGEPVGEWYKDLVPAILERQDDDGSWVNDKDWFWEDFPELATVYALNALGTATLPWTEGVTIQIELQSEKNLHVLDGDRRHSGDGIMTRSSYEEGIPGSTVTKGEDYTKVVIDNADADAYTIGMTEGKDDHYELKVTVIKDGKTLDETISSGDSSEDVQTIMVINSIAAPGSVYLEEPSVGGHSVSGESLPDFEYPVEDETSYTPFIIAAVVVLVFLIIISLVLVRKKK